jgi:hypothetical protein
MTKPGSELEKALSKRRDSQEWSSAKMSYGKEIEFMPRSESTFCFMHQFHVQRMGKDTFE